MAGYSVSNAQGFTEIGSELGIVYDFKTAEYGGGVSFVDFNQDGLDDLTFATDSTSHIKFHLNTGSGFEILPSLTTELSEVKQVLWIDYDNDGDLDLYITSNKKNRLYKNTGDLILEDVTSEMGFSDPSLISYASTWMDYDEDGFLDLFVTYRTPEETGYLTLYRNMEGASFEEFTIQAGLLNKGNSVLAMTTLDYNNDGWTDLFLAQDWEQGNQLLKNMGNGTFKDVSQVSGANQKMNSMTATTGDYDGDGWMDIYISNTTMGNVLLRNNKDETFTEVTEEMNVDIRALTFGSAFFDADNDGDLDLQVVGFRSNYLFENKGYSQPFERVETEWGFENDADFNNGLALGDYNQDGHLDLVRNCVTRTGFASSENSFWRNDFNENEYLIVDLEGTISNSNAIGAILRLYTNNKIMVRRIAAGESFNSQHAYSQFFGMGQSTLADSLVIEWPNNNITVVKDIASGQRIMLQEPTLGCTDPLACNFNSKATGDNGFCRYNQEFMNCNSCVNDTDQDGVCDELEISGCMDISACNFSSIATDDNGSCWYLPVYEIEGSSTPIPLQLEAYSYQTDNQSTYEWTVENGSIVIGQGSPSVQVIWHESSSGNLQVTEISSEGCKSTTVLKQVIIQNNILSSSVANDPVVYPNPATDFIYIKSGRNITAQEYTLTDLTGRIFKRGSFNTDETSVFIGSLPAGLYIVTLMKENQINSWKITVTK